MLSHRLLPKLDPNANSSSDGTHFPSLLLSVRSEHSRLPLRTFHHAIPRLLHHVSLLIKSRRGGRRRLWSNQKKTRRRHPIGWVMPCAVYPLAYPIRLVEKLHAYFRETSPLVCARWRSRIPVSPSLGRGQPRFNSPTREVELAHRLYARPLADVYAGHPYIWV